VQFPTSFFVKTGLQFHVLMEVFVIERVEPSNDKRGIENDQKAKVLLGITAQ